MKIIKRYANRRLYDSDSSKTVTLKNIAEFIKSGENVKIIDNNNNQDITSKILGQVFLKVNLSGENKEFNIYLMTALIREGSKNLHELFKKLIQAGVGTANLSDTRLEMLVDSMVRDGYISAAEKVNYINDLFKNAANQAEKYKKEVESKVSQFIKFDNSDNIENLTKKIDDLSKAVKEIKDSQSRQNKK